MKRKTNQAFKGRTAVDSSSASSNSFKVTQYFYDGMSAHPALTEYFVPELSDAKLATELAFNNFISLSVSAGTTKKDAVAEIAVHAVKPFQIEALPDCLDRQISVPSHVFFDHVWREIEAIASGWPNMRWWYSERGLGMEILTNSALEKKIRLRQLGSFDQLAGKMFSGATKNGIATIQEVCEIARALDTNGFQLKESLSPSEWKPIAEFNQKYSAKAVKSFEQALKVAPRSIRRRFSRAKTRYERAIKS